MAYTEEILRSTSQALLQFIQKNDPIQLSNNIQTLINQEGAHPLFDALTQILTSMRKLEIKNLQHLIRQLSSKLARQDITTLLTLFEKKLLLFILEHFYTKSDDLDFKLHIWKHKYNLLNEALELSQQLPENQVTNTIINDLIDASIVLALFSLYVGNLKDVITYLSRIYPTIIGKYKFFPSKSSFYLRLFSLLLLKIHNNASLIAIMKDILGTTISLEDPLQISIKLLNDAIALDEKISDSENLAIDYFFLALVYHTQRKYKQALQEIKRAQQLHEELENKEGYLEDTILLALVINESKQKETALEILNQALKIAIETDKREEIAQLNLIISFILRDLHKYEESLKYLRTALVIFKQEKIGIEIDLIESYSALGSLLRKMQQFETARGFFQKILEVERVTKMQSIIMEIHAQLAMTYRLLGDITAFHEYYNEFLTLYTRTRDHYRFAIDEYQIGLVFCNLQEFEEGIDHLGKALQVFFNLKDKNYLMELIPIFSEIYSALDNVQMSDVLSNEEKDIEFRTKYLLDRIKPSIPLKDITIPPPVAPPVLKTTSAELPTATVVDTKPSPELPTATVVDTKPSPELPTATVVDTKPSPDIAIKKTPTPPQAPISSPAPPTLAQKPTEKSEIQKPTEQSFQPQKFIGRQCPKCKFLITDPSFQFCPNCATSLTSARLCSKCGYSIEDPSFKFCPKCANPL
ncbi:MAG: tetratricopeptide repeat protein [Candidatus Helarchaeota archaeon]